MTFRTGWYATDLGEYRSCRYTYERYRYEDQPPLDAARFVGGYEWFGNLGSPDTSAAEELAALDQRLGALGVRLPADFFTFYSHSLLREALDDVSVTSCWTDLSREPIPSPAEPDAWLVRFLRDQQDCVMWYLYLRKGGETFVVCSPADLEYLAGMDPAQRKAEGVEQPEIVWCSPTFEQFAFRFWIECRAWRGLHRYEGVELDEMSQGYLRRFPNQPAVPPAAQPAVPQPRPEPAVASAAVPEPGAAAESVVAAPPARVLPVAPPNAAQAVAVPPNAAPAAVAPPVVDLAAVPAAVPVAAPAVGVR